MAGPRLTTIAFTVVAMLIAGCGGDARANYQHELSQVGVQVRSALESLPRDESTPVTPAHMHTLADKLRAAADDLEDADAPEGVTSAQGQMVRGLTGVAAAFDGLADDLSHARGDEAKAELFVAFASNTKIDAAFDDISEAQGKYAGAGFHVFARDRVPTVGRSAAAARTR